ncbi:hypothetical protein [Sphingomonas sp. 3P27F8]|uniref:hypothetical protein n=1 Tax=Sphingomonas sp. 3P27F8 TaxID=2502213 RepID=UPI0010F56D94|nr:hypothetical protein [Sphingomonas sp. 3P27F8]
MDLSFARFDRRADTAVPLPVGLAVLLVRMAARQAASPTAIAHARMTHGPVVATRFAPDDGSFNGATARALAEWKDE